MLIDLRRNFVLACALLAALLCNARPVLAQTALHSWPQRPVRFIVTLGAGSGVDIGMRLLADRLPKLWNQPVVVDFLFAGFLKKYNLDMARVPYRNPQEANNDLALGRIQVAEASLATLRPQLEAGKIKLLAVTNSVRAPTLPDLPTVKEAGY